MIENTFKRWLRSEIEYGSYDIDELKIIVTDHDEIEDVWDNFCTYRRSEILESVISEIKNVIEKITH